jgi:predicted nucleic-acid-binding protein
MSSFVTLDTNLYVSFFTRRDEKQFADARGYMSKLWQNEIEVFLPSIIVGEIFYIFTKLYDFEKQNACQSIQSLVNLPNLMTENKDVLLLAIENYSTKNLDFVDCYILSINELQKYKLKTFDKKLKNQIGKL